MNMKYLLAAATAAFALGTVGAATAQTTTETKVSTAANADGSKTTKVVHIRKHKSRHAKRILGVKVGHKTHVSKTEHTTTTKADGSKSTDVTTTNK